MDGQQEVRSDERVWAALAHGSIILGGASNGVLGPLVALVIWLTQRERSAYVAFQSLQALVYQVAALLLTFGAWICWGLLWMLLFIPQWIVSPQLYQSNPPGGFWLGLMLMAVPLAITVGTFFYGLWGALRTLSGHPFRYAVIGRWLAGQR
ncbi:MAG: DUF4870 domain-containing protein [Chloroflexi bacterium]|nr:DUF4870 domain-containing protein [Chloroflexota bacterium]